MSIHLSNFKRFLMIFSLLASVAILGGCDSLEGDDGKAGATGATGATGPAGDTGPAGADVDPATVTDLQDQIDALAASIEEAENVNPEQCAICHSEVGEEHQDVYDGYTDGTADGGTRLAMAITDVASVYNAVDDDYDVTVTFTITKDGMPYVSADLSELEQLRVGSSVYDKDTRTYDQGWVFFGGWAPTGTDGEYTAIKADMDYAPELENAQVYGYIADEAIHVEQPEGTHVHLYEDFASAAKAYGTAMDTDVDAYVSAANVAGCEKCHGTPYAKHGYRAPEVAGIPDFASCKVCHTASRDGGHEDWQILVDDPERFVTVHDGTVPLTPAEEAQYAYTASVMNDTHMSHAMEFPYPQSMANCVTCHEGKLAMILGDDDFESETCKSCHPVNGPEGGTDSHRAPALQALWDDVQAGFHDITDDCNSACHTVAADVGPVFSELHAGYDTRVFAAENVRYSDIFSVSIDDADLVGNILTVDFSAVTDAANPTTLDGDDILPTLMVGLYGWDSKDYIQGPHERSSDTNGDGVIDRSDGRDLEFEIGDTNPNFNVVTAADGVYQVEVDLTNWADRSADGSVKRAEIAVMPELDDADGDTVALIAPSVTFDLTANAMDAGYFDEIVDVDGCNNCHEALAITFHGPDRGGNVVVCRLCHITKSGGSHIEMQSRSIDSYVHAIHSMQAFDTDDIDFADPVEAVMYDLHINHTYPNFTIFNCESCHNPGTYDVPDQAESMPGLHSASNDITGWDRNIGTVPEYVTGPASRACGGCHRADLINADEAGHLAAFNQHTGEFGYLVENDDDDMVRDSVIETIMSMFQ